MKKWIGVCISFGFLGLLVLNHQPTELMMGIREGNFEKILNPELHFSDMSNVFNQVEAFPLFIATLVSVALLVIRAVRWHYLLLPKYRIPFHPLFSATMIGFMANNVLPARAGEIVRAYVLSRKESIPASFTIATLAVERMFDVFCILLMFSITFHLASYPPWVSHVGTAATVIFMGFCILFLLVVVKPNLCVDVLSRWSRILLKRYHSRIERIVTSFVEGVGVLKSKKLVFITLLLSIVHWLMFGWFIQLGLTGFGVSVPNIAPYFVLSIICFGFAIPSSPGYIGTFQWFMEKSLSIYNVPKSLSFPFSIGIHLILFVPTTALGFIYFFKENLSWENLQKQSESGKVSTGEKAS